VRLVDKLLDAMQLRAQRGETIDLIEQFAGAIPVEIIGNLLGVPHDERGADARLVARDPRRARAGAEPRARSRGNAAVRDMLAYLEGLSNAGARHRRSGDRRAHAADPRRGH